MTSPAVSVCIPLYNGAQYLDDCLASVVRQDCADFEALIVDDGSSDGSLAIARRWADSDSRFQVHVNERNLGLVGNWNRCLELAEGRWIKFLFQDDLMKPACLSALLRSGESGGGFVACSRELLFEGEIPPHLLAQYDAHRKLLFRIYGNAERLSADDYSREKLDALGWNIVGEPSVTLIRRNLFDRYGLFDPLLVQFCDSEMWNRLGSNVGVDYVASEQVSFRVHRGSASEANRSRNFRSWVLDEIIELNRLCYAPQMEPLRRHARAAGKWRGLTKRLNSRVNAAIDTANEAARSVPPDHTLKDQLTAVLTQLPGYARARLIHWLYRARLPFRRAV